MAHRHLIARPARKERLKECAAHLAVQAADAVNRATPADCQVRHVEFFIGIVGVLASKRQQVAETDLYGFGVKVEVLGNQVRWEAIETGRHGRVRSKKIASARHRKRNIEGLPGFLHPGPGPFKHREGRMPFVEMTDFGTKSELA